MRTFACCFRLLGLLVGERMGRVWTFGAVFGLLKEQLFVFLTFVVLGIYRWLRDMVGVATGEFEGNLKRV